MRLHLQSGVDGNIYREFSPQTYYRRRASGVSGLASGSIQQITAAAGTIGSMIPVAGPFIAAAASIAITIENLFSGCGQTCVQTSNAANQAGALLEQLVHNYVSQPIRTTSMQAAALQAFDQTWAQLSSTCSNPQFGAAGQRCVSDRQRGACTWKASPGGWSQNSDGTWTYTFAGPAGSGTTCWNWFVGYRDPIANDPGVIPDSFLSAQTSTPVSTSSPISASGTVLINGSPVAATTVTQSGGVPQSTSGLLPLFLIGGGILLVMAAAG